MYRRALVCVASLPNDTVTHSLLREDLLKSKWEGSYPHPSYSDQTKKISQLGYLQAFCSNDNEDEKGLKGHSGMRRAWRMSILSRNGSTITLR